MLSSNPTMKDALEQTYRKRWAGRRPEKTMMSQAVIAAAEVGGLTRPSAADWMRARIGDITEDHVRRATAIWYGEGSSPATINKRLNCLSAMGVSVQGLRVKEPKVLKWWLRPEAEREVCAWLRTAPFPHAATLMSLIVWTTRTGLRIEETLRLSWLDFPPSYMEVTVPGTKTADAQATLALGPEMQETMKDLLAAYGPDGKPFPITYEQAKDGWQEVREHFGWEGIPTATLKALRRSAARYLHYDRGMPLDMVRQYLRHEDIETTMGYLRLTGGVSLDEQRRYLG